VASEWRAVGRFGLVGALVALVALMAAPPAAARVLLSVDEALGLAFAGCEVARQTVYLTEAELAEARRLAGVEIPGAVVRPYRGRCPEEGQARGQGEGEGGGTAYFDTHRVRTLPETVMVVVAPDGRVRRIEVLSFDEPPDYLPRAVWYGQLVGRRLDDELALGRSIRGVTGATLTVRATTEAVRRVLALDHVIRAREAGAAAGDSSPAGSGVGDRRRGAGPAGGAAATGTQAPAAGGSG
jgi:hypothetical protein